MTSKDVLFQIRLAMLYKDALQKDVAEKTGINLRTLQRRFENPSGFTIDELIKISEMLDIKFMFMYNTTPIQPFTITPTSPYITLPEHEEGKPFILKDINVAHSRQRCEGCYIYEQIKKGEPVVTDACTFCGTNPNKITCRGMNNEN